MRPGARRAGPGVRAASAGADRLVPMLTAAELARARGRRGRRDSRRPGRRRRRAGPGGRRRHRGRAATPATVVLVAGVDGRRRARASRRCATCCWSRSRCCVVALAALAWRVIGATLRPVEALRPGAEEISAAAPAARPAAGAGRRRRDPPAGRHPQRHARPAGGRPRPAARVRRRRRARAAQPAGQHAHPAGGGRAAGRGGRRSADLLTDVDRLGRLVDDLLLLARADEGDPRLRRVETVDLSRAGRRGRAARTPAPGCRSTGRRRPGRCWTSATRTRCAGSLANLVDNAVRHAAPASRHRRPASRRGGRWSTVADDGPGIPAADRERVFDRFTRLDDARARDDGGAGLGLAIVRELVRAHGGTITLADASPGLSATVQLPAAPAAPTDPADPVGDHEVSCTLDGVSPR